MRSVLLGFALGVWWLQQQARLPEHPGTGLALSTGCVAAALVLAHRVRRQPAGAPRTRVAAEFAVLLTALSAVFGGYHWAALVARGKLADTLPTQWEDRPIALVGLVDELPLATDRGWRFALAVERVETAGATIPSRLSLGWYADVRRSDPGTALDNRSAAPAKALPAVRAGERWRLTVRLRRPHGSANPHGFDLEAWLFDNGFRATGYVVAGGVNERLDEFAGRPMDWIQRLREHFRDRITGALAERPYAGVIVALAIGEQRAIPAEQWQMFNRTGIGHLLAISGMHVTLFATLVGGAVMFVWRRVPALVVRIPAQRAAALVGTVASGAYVLLAGAQVPAQRTFFMLVAAAVALWLGTPGRATSILLVALGAVLVADPAAVRAAGFWLSFCAVAVILAAAYGRLGPLGSLRSAVRTQCAVSVGLAPLTLLLFQQLSLISPIANALAIPVVTFVVVPLTLGGLALPFAFPLALAHQAFAWVAAAMEPMAALPSSVWAQHAPGPGAMALAMVATLGAVGPRGLPGRWALAMWFAPVFLWLPAAPAAGTFDLAVLDVGQGLAAVVRTHAHALVYDAGPRFGDHADSGSRIVVPHLRGEGIRSVDVLIVSHDDADHSGGVASVLDVVPVERVLASGDLRTPVWERRAGEGRPPVRCESGMAWEWDGVRFELLHPAPSLYAEKWRGNDRSCVLRVSAAGGGALLPGDIEARAERALLDEARLASGAVPGAGALGADVVIVPHHGSATSSTAPFIAAVGAADAVFAVGSHNRFRHPRPDVVDRWRGAGARVHRSDRDGALLFRFGPAREVRAWRVEQRRHWRDEYVEPGDPSLTATARGRWTSERDAARTTASRRAARSKTPAGGVPAAGAEVVGSPVPGDPGTGINDGDRYPSGGPDGHPANGLDSSAHRNSDWDDRSHSR